MSSGSVADAVSLVKELSRVEQPALIAIDGHSAAGKSTLAHTLQSALRDVQIVYGDDFYRVMPETERFRLDAPAGYGHYYDWERLERQVLIPLSDQQTARYKAYNWEIGALSDWKVVQPYGAVIVEGVFSARPELRGYYDAIFLVETEEKTRAWRQKQRADAVDAWLERWDAAERFYMQTCNPNAYADLVISLV
ncbi:MAG: hypothetical protein AVDCRST_MAG86-1619 [uncultured Truepera sp.]|uniref:Phosphoribulokinase/uridine kinase domain-containing protein n=1 Tax=uncultured Truepera sp. TaxID=543023 RepID=A0A6J4VCX8_9DEIN|nr:MAG: hypothetical protein AVDCRST_MAG86-1619 [uncultured Truepera sp.]